MDRRTIHSKLEGATLTGGDKLPYSPEAMMPDAFCVTVPPRARVPVASIRPLFVIAFVMEPSP